MDDASEWVSAAEAAAMLTAKYDNPATAKEVIADLLADGKLRARADRVWLSDVYDLNEAWRGRDKDNPDCNISLSAKDWKKSKNWLRDRARWRWDENRFVLITSVSPRSWRFLDGVSFSRTDVETLIGIKIDDTPRKPQRGPQPDLKRWNRFWMTVVRFAAEGKLTRHHQANKSQLSANLLNEMVKPPFNPATVKPIVADIWDEFVKDN